MSRWKKQSEAKNDKAEQSPKKKRTRIVRPFPTHSFEDALEFASAIQSSSGSQPIKRLTLFDQIEKSPESSASRQLITSSNKYGLLKGNPASEELQLTEHGNKATNPDIPKPIRVRSWFESAIESIEVFKSLYQKFENQRLPSTPVLLDAAKEFNVASEVAQEAVDTFISNLKYVGVLQTLSGAERIVTLDHVVTEAKNQPGNTQTHFSSAGNDLITNAKADFETTCFVICPIGSDDSEDRKHSDLMLGSIIEPALEGFPLKVVRADQIAESGIITKQIIEYVWYSRLVIADLSYHNPNVFYELAIRHAANKPVIQLIRKSDKIPFDLQQNRTIMIDTSDIYSLVPQIPTYKSEISTHARRALEEGAIVDNPLSAFLPNLGN